MTYISIIIDITSHGYHDGSASTVRSQYLLHGGISGVVCLFGAICQAALLGTLWWITAVR